MEFTLLQNLQGKVVALEYGSKNRHTTETLTGAVVGLCCGNRVVMLAIPKPCSREVRDKMERAVAEAPTVAGAPVPGPTISNVRGIRREIYTDFHVRFLSIEDVHSVELFTGVRAEITINKIFNQVPPERFFDDLPDKVEKPDGTMRLVDDSVRKATHEFCWQDVCRRLFEMQLPDCTVQPPPQEPEQQQQGA